jgi:hypothetical protein
MILTTTVKRRLARVAQTLEEVVNSDDPDDAEGDNAILLTLHKSVEDLQGLIVDATRHWLRHPDVRMWLDCERKARETVQAVIDDAEQTTPSVAFQQKQDEPLEE